MIILVSLRLKLNDDSPIEVTDGGIVNSTSDEQKLKVESLIDVKVFGNETCDSDEHPLNEDSLIEVTDEGISI